MAITPELIEDYLGRDFRDSDRWKNADTEQIKNFLFEKLPTRPRFVHQPYHHQWVCLGLGWLYRRFYFALDMGTGKSKIAIDLFRFWTRFKQARRMLVCVPNVTNIWQWREQLEEHAPELSFALLTGSKAKKEAAWEGDAQVVVATYAGVRAMLCGRVTGKKGQQPIDAKVKQVNKLFDFFILDEASILGKVTSLTFRLFRQIAKGPHRMYLMSGTQFSADPQALWSQFYLLDQGWLLGNTLKFFRAALFRENTTPWGTEWKLRAKNRPVLHRMLRHSSVRFSEDECLDLPDSVGGIDNPMLISVDFASAQWKAYDSVVEDAAITLKVEGETTPEAYLNKRLICSGYTRSETMGYLPIPGPNPKLDALIELLSEVEERHGKGGKVVVAHHYQFTGKLIAKRLQEKGIAHAELRGGQSADAALTAFTKDPKCRVLVASRSAAFGLNLQCARIMVFFETPDSLEVRRQFERRIYRMGQTRTTYYYDLVMRNSVDDAIIRALRRNKNVWSSVVDGK